MHGGGAPLPGQNSEVQSPEGHEEPSVSRRGALEEEEGPV